MAARAFLAIVSVILCCCSSLSNAKQFRHWYGFYSNTIGKIAGSHCYHNYSTGEFPVYGKYTMGTELQRCKGMTTCLLENIDDIDKADMQSATVILGLMPTILSYFGPTVGEMALVSSRRPVLAMLLVLGAPAIFATRPFEFNNPRKSLKKNAGAFVIRRQSSFRATAIVAAQYFMLSLAVATCLQTSMQLGSSTILSWKCSASYLQLGWNFMPLAPHLCAAFSSHYSKINRHTKRKRTPPGTFSRALAKWFWNELKPSANHAEVDLSKSLSDGRIAVCLNWLAVLLGYLHWIYGTLLFSSALFIGTLDAIGVIARYLASALICRMILLIEIAGIKGVEEAQTANWDTQWNCEEENGRNW